MAETRRGLLRRRLPPSLRFGATGQRAGEGRWETSNHNETVPSGTEESFFRRRWGLDRITLLRTQR